MALLLPLLNLKPVLVLFSHSKLSLIWVLIITIKKFRTKKNAT